MPHFKHFSVDIWAKESTSFVCIGTAGLSAGFNEENDMFGLRRAVPGGTHRIAEASGAAGAGLNKRSLRSGMISGTRVATQHGWCDVTKITPGDRVLTFDGGLQVIQSVHQEYMSQRLAESLLEVPALALGNRETVFLAETQNVMVESDTAEELFGDPFTLIPALALEGIRGIRRVTAPSEARIVTLEFAQDQVVFANIGALFFCPRSNVVDLVAAAQSDVPNYEPLSLSEACLLVEALAIEDVEGRAKQEHAAA